MPVGPLLLFDTPAEPGGDVFGTGYTIRRRRYVAYILASLVLLIVA